MTSVTFTLLFLDPPPISVEVMYESLLSPQTTDLSRAKSILRRGVAAISKLKKRRFRLPQFLFSASRAAYNYNRAVKITRGGPPPSRPLPRDMMRWDGHMSACAHSYRAEKKRFVRGCEIFLRGPA